MKKYFIITTSSLAATDTILCKAVAAKEKNKKTAFVCNTKSYMFYKLKSSKQATATVKNSTDTLCRNGTALFGQETIKMHVAFLYACKATFENTCLEQKMCAYAEYEIFLTNLLAAHYNNYCGSLQQSTINRFYTAGFVLNAVVAMQPSNKNSAAYNIYFVNKLALKCAEEARFVSYTALLRATGREKSLALESALLLLKQRTACRSKK